eukprot:scaffold7419_cov34-Phaeocystis_antarctica.AAC.1
MRVGVRVGPSSHLVEVGEAVHVGAAVKSASSENGQLDPEPEAEALSALSAAPLFLGRVSAPPSSSPSDEELEHAPKRRAWPCPAPPPVSPCCSSRPPRRDDPPVAAASARATEAGARGWCMRASLPPPWPHRRTRAADRGRKGRRGHHRAAAGRAAVAAAAWERMRRATPAGRARPPAAPCPVPPCPAPPCPADAAPAG